MESDTNWVGIGRSAEWRGSQEAITDLDFLRSRIPGYADYANQNARHLVDQQLRAYLGETLAAIPDRMRPSTAFAKELDGLIVRCEFTDQREIRAVDQARFDGALLERVHAVDRAMVEAADRLGAATEAETLRTALHDAARALDRRFGALFDAARRALRITPKGHSPDGRVDTGGCGDRHRPVAPSAGNLGTAWQSVRSANEGDSDTDIGAKSFGYAQSDDHARRR